ncbi:MAG: hypothetical protein M9921_01455 [Fimbriimonadaceae bacterium]|nr:hypothetical protein [Fimbriimonadaceae bacterium]
MKVGFGIRGWWSQWSVDRAGVETGCYRAEQLREMLDRGELDAHMWLRHFLTRRYALVGEVLYGNNLATDEEFEAWFPAPSRFSSAVSH